MSVSLTRTVLPLPEESGKPLARLDPDTLAALGVGVGDVVAIMGRRTTAARVQPMHRSDWGKEIVQLADIVRSNAGAAPGDKVRIWAAAATQPRGVTLRPLGWTAAFALKQPDNYLGMLLDGVPVMPGDRVRPAQVGTRWQEYLVEAVDGEAPALIEAGTTITVQTDTEQAYSEQTAGYAAIGGLAPEVQRVRELVEMPLSHPALFARLGIETPKGVLLYGPPGCGKTLIARAVAAETQAHFVYINGPEIMHKFYGQSEANLRARFDEAKAMAPSILFLDEIDAIAPRRSHVLGDVEKRVVAQLLTLMDGLDRRGQVVVIAASNMPAAIDPALRRPGRFDREIHVGIPDRAGRLEILQIHAGRLPLAPDVDLAALAARAHGYVGADLAALCREAAMMALRRHMPAAAAAATVPDTLAIAMADFEDALGEVQPSALRELCSEQPADTWDQIGGLGAAKAALLDAVQRPLAHPLLYERSGARPPRAILLTGKPGVGKTLLARALAGRCGLQLLPVSASDLVSRFSGEAERGLQEVFRRARMISPCLIFLDNLDSLLPGRGEADRRARIADHLAAELDGSRAVPGLIVVGAAHRPDRVDPTLLQPGRFDLVIELSLPDTAERAEILAIHLQRLRLAPDADAAWLAANSAGFSGADLAAVVNRAALAAVAEYLGSVGPPVPTDAPAVLVHQRHLVAGLAQVARARQGRRSRAVSGRLQRRIQQGREGGAHGSGTPVV